jgi:hypothetical protein
MIFARNRKVGSLKAQDLCDRDSTLPTLDPSELLRNTQGIPEATPSNPSAKVIQNG